MSIFLSIIIPTYNAGNNLARALESVLQQTFSSFEVLIMDGLSTDNTSAIVESFHDERIQLFREGDRGIYDAMNKGIAKARGAWLYFLGSDDELYTSTVLEEIFPQNLTYY